ncbi:carboxypeptidase-like regulatory domain-containing protein [Hyalangium gracile]|uniref:carboxypeptidase-like regulatory domain-containing protein n=1 Tax=Hyalangium gracile TaxID=394092 RepID=UPI001CCF815C|nr:carboxypeptidase-like regulatory domain-containing protein [Hyalangium gracile]
MPQRTVLLRTTILAVFLLLLPDAAWAQVNLSGQVRFSDGSPATAVGVFAYDALNNSSYFHTTTDASGQYGLQVPAGTYDVGVQLFSGTFAGSEILVASGSFTNDTALDLVTHDIVLSGRILENSGLPSAYAQILGNGTSGSMHATADFQGLFSVRVLPGTYTGMRIVGNLQSLCWMEQLPDEALSNSLYKDYQFPELFECEVPMRVDGLSGGGDGRDESQPMDPPPNPPSDPGGDGLE